MTSSYAINPHVLNLGHGLSGWLLRDQADDTKNIPYKFDKRVADALIASGDYFEALATELDAVSQAVSKLDTSSYHKLESLINDLFYYSRTYKIVKKSAKSNPTKYEY